MKHYQFCNIEITSQFISASVYKNNNYIMKVAWKSILSLIGNQELLNIKVLV